MDTSEEYIEMCSKLPSEIRESVPRDHHGCMGGDKSFFGYHKKLNGMVWLPRQDQLQDMLDDVFSNREIVPLTTKLHDVCIHLIQKHNFNGRTMEQLWLAFVMHEKYGKTWNGKEWI